MFLDYNSHKSWPAQLMGVLVQEPLETQGWEPQLCRDHAEQFHSVVNSPSCFRFLRGARELFSSQMGHDWKILCVCWQIVRGCGCWGSHQAPQCGGFTQPQASPHPALMSRTFMTPVLISCPVDLYPTPHQEPTTRRSLWAGAKYR